MEVDGSGEQPRRYDVTPQDLGLEPASPQSIPAGRPDANARTARAIFAGESGPARDLAVLNAGAAIYTAGRADDLRGGVDAAVEAVDSGAAAHTLERYVALSQELAA